MEGGLSKQGSLEMIPLEVFWTVNGEIRVTQLKHTAAELVHRRTNPTT